MFRVKVCGVRRDQDVRWVGESRADAVGLNFHPSSVRFVEPGQDERLSALAKSLSLIRIGIFVDQGVGEVDEIASRTDLDMIQLHGDQTLDWAVDLQRLTHKPVLRAVKLPIMPLNEATIDAEVMPWIDAGCDVLLDADGGAMHGGSGQTLDWESIGNWHQNRNANFAIAGGITPLNVVAAIEQTGAVAVDAASGTEAKRGTKDRAMLRDLAELADSALGNKPRPV